MGHILVPLALEHSPRGHLKLAGARARTLFEFSLVDVAVGIGMFSDTIWDPVLEVTLVSGACRGHQLAEAVALILQVLTLKDVAVGHCQFALTSELARLEHALVARAIRESHLALAMLDALDVLSLEPRTILVLLTAATMGNTPLPLTFVGDIRRFPHNLTLALPLTGDKLTLVNIIAVRRDLFPDTMGHPLVPLTIVLLAVSHHHLPLAMALTLPEVSIVNISILKR